MIRRATIHNFRSIRSLDVTFEPLTVIVGPNASGKTSLLQALDPSRHWTPSDAPNHQPNNFPSVQVTLFSGQQPVRNQGMGAPGRWVTDAYKTIRFDLAVLRGPNMLQRVGSVGERGENLANTFGSLTRKQQAVLAEHLCELVPVFKDVNTNPIANGQHALRFQDRWNDSVWYSPDEVSDGTMLLTAFLTLQFQDPPVDIIAIEEPDRGLHPYLLGQLIDFFRKLTEGKIGLRPMQVILATHSAELLEHVRPEEVRFLSRDAKSGNVIAGAVDTKAPDWKSTFDEYQESLGSVWLSGGLGGVPGGP